MGRIKCAFFGHNWRRGTIKSLRHSVLYPDVMFCLSCKARKEAPATFYTPMDIPPPTPSKEANLDKGENDERA